MVVVPTAIPVADAVTVQLEPRVQVCPFTVVLEFVRPAFGIVATLPRTPPEVNVAYPAVVIPENVGVVSLVLKSVKVPIVVSEEVTTLEASVVPVSVPAGAITAAVLAAVSWPSAFTVNVGIAVELP